MAIIGIFFVVWVGLIVAPSIHDGLPAILAILKSGFENPTKINLCQDSIKTVLAFLLAYGIAMGAVLSSQHNYRRGEEHGSATWGTPEDLRKKYMQHPPLLKRIMYAVSLYKENGDWHD